MKKVFTSDQLYNMVIGQICTENPDVRKGCLYYVCNLNDALEAYHLMSEDEKKEFDKRILSEAYRYKDQILDMVNYSDYETYEDFMKAKEESVRHNTECIAKSLSEYLI